MYDYNARYYLPHIGRFLSADTLVPDPSNSQSFNRYSYVLNNPLKFVDPSGHCGADVTGSYLVDQTLYNDCLALRTQLEQQYDITIEGVWRWDEMVSLSEAIQLFLQWSGKSFSETFGEALKGFRMGEGEWSCYSSANSDCSFMSSWMNGTEGFVNIGRVVEDSRDFQRVALHEMGHAYLELHPNVLEEWELFSGWEWGDLNQRCFIFFTCSYGEGWLKTPQNPTDYGWWAARGGLGNARQAAQEDFVEALSLLLTHQLWIHPYYMHPYETWLQDLNWR